MILEDIMNKDVVTLKETDSIQTAIEIIRDKKIRHIPIVNNEKQLVGLVSNQDIRDATPSIFRANFHLEDLQKPISTIMKKDIITGHPLDFVEEVAAVFYENHIGCMPILSENKLVGIITETDLLHTFVKLTGAHQPGSQLEIKVPNRSGVLSEVTSIIKTKKANIHSVLVYPDKQDESYKILVVRVQIMNPQAVVQALKENGFDVLWPKIPEMLS
ncbi:acetoin utilization AcuB family protein [Peribacillus alkalitolerans]|uniref:acetoin utilization AcuB family protein n=1 Tax=Peribacillus alkalitolerans TaxID=1550385 RepID=UPI0013CFF2B0|nr:acetoin utilization AcuB family protein [Peribacillus alkalitolerans]